MTLMDKAMAFIGFAFGVAIIAFGVGAAIVMILAMLKEDDE